MRRAIQACPAAMKFNGSNTKVTGVSLGWSGAQAHTFAVWMRYGGLVAGNGIAVAVGESVVTKHPFIGVSSGKTVWGNYGGTVLFPRPCVMGWRRVVATYDGANAQLWTNGAKSSSLTASTVAINTSVPYLGNFAGGGYALQGLLWRAMIWNRALTDAEIESDFFDGTVASSGLVRYWKLEDLTGGTTTHEEIGNTDDTVANGALETTDLPFKTRTAA